MIDLRVPSPFPRLAYFSRIIYTCDGNRFILQLLAEYSESKRCSESRRYGESKGCSESKGCTDT